MATKISHVLLMAMPALLLAGEAAAQMLQAPVQVTAGVVPPNIMFTLDDSGSMNLECVPDECTGGFGFSITPLSNNAPVNPVGGYSTLRKLITYDKGSPSIFNRTVRSAAVNPLYYNPAVRYLPWLKSDGSRYPAYAGTAARDFPEIPGSADVQNLAVSRPIRARWCVSPTTSSCPEDSQNVYVAQYFNLTGSDIKAVSSYTQVLIQPGGVYPKAAARVDCTTSAGVCTYAEELQNFSNWYSYHRSRMRVAIAGTAEAFSVIPATYRVGYGRLSKMESSDIDGLSVDTIEKGVRPFVDTAAGNKGSFYTWLFQQKPSEGTPLRRAMDAVGRYYSYTDNKGPWGSEPGSNNTAPQLACRRSFHIMMTDGMWNEDPASTPAARENVDNTAGPVITGPRSQRYTYLPSGPYRDGHADTLADVAMYYWNRDLHPGLANEVKASDENPAFWQHMVNYTVAFGLAGILNPKTDLPALTSGSKSWPQPDADRKENIDDLWHAAVNSRGRYLSASNTTEYSLALQNIINDIAAMNGNEAGVAVSSRTLTPSSVTRKYVPEFSSLRWSGDLKAINMSSTGADQNVAWTAAANMPAHGSRNIFTYNKAAAGAKGIAFAWADLPDPMRVRVFGSASGGVDLLNYLRGDRTNEAGTYRPRASVLGDIVNSTPVLVKDQVDGQYDFLPPNVAGQSTYRRFLTAKKLRQAQLFVGANDGMLHAFSDANGAETFAFVPDPVLGNLKNLASPVYRHQYFVDGPLTEADVYDTTASKWRNLVLGGTGAGAKSLFAINVPVVNYPGTATNAPAALTSAQSAPGASDILWNISSADPDYAELGYVLHAAQHGVMRDGSWVVIVGNGYESAGKKAQLFVINALTGALIKKLDTGAGSASSPNGLGGVRVVRDANARIVAAYAGDLLGNLWKFDFSSDRQSDWAVAFGTTGSARNPLYATAAPEPITAAPAYALHPAGGVMILFGTGKLHETGDAAETRQRALYGVWDKVLLGAASTTATDRVTDASTMVAQAFTPLPLPGTTGTFYGLTVTPVDYHTKRGWRLPLTMSQGQRLVNAPEMTNGRVSMQTVTPSLPTCAAPSLLRHEMSLAPFMKAIEQPTFDTNGDTVITSADVLTAVAASTSNNGPLTWVRNTKGGVTSLDASGKGIEQSPFGRVAKRYWRQVIAQPN
ncbi:type IV pilus assembly protein PilY1 [Polaromonas sp. YR568]|uniref:pilus assembly protein n=1 Tax=Polaromonas sp. YR568 TaxID=1855301 RepID=UPI0008E61F10|nr:PilC/PilY family type IV pilus protein [Polaromonas sp. YR568]SFU66898.1 type IV pilus assembly protein PilY1 [Polaromonas sp. YR568]